MGIYDRDYYRQSLPRGGFGYFDAWSVTTWLIAINVVIFFVDAALLRATRGPAWDPYDDEQSVEQVQKHARPASGGQFDAMSPLQRWGHFSVAKAIKSAQVWRFITFQFLHASPVHLIMNMLGLYLFGPIVEAQFGARRFAAFYLLCGLAGAVVYLLLSVTHVLMLNIDAPMVGASAGIFGMLVAAAMIAPNVEIFYYLFPVTIGMLALFAMLMALYGVISLGYNSGGEAAHLGGGVLGFAIMKNQHWLNVFAPPRQGAMATAASSSARRRKRPPFQKDWSKDFNR
jgi:membrane associated rhomboid family serine protease